MVYEKKGDTLLFNMNIKLDAIFTVILRLDEYSKSEIVISYLCWYKIIVDMLSSNIGIVKGGMGHWEHVPILLHISPCSPSCVPILLEMRVLVFSTSRILPQNQCSLTRAREWGSELRAREGGGGQNLPSLPTQLL